MTTEQRYVGGESHATTSEPTAQNDLQTANTEAQATPVLPIEPILVALPDFLARHFISHEKTASLQNAINKVFRKFYDSGEYQKLDTIEASLPYVALENDLITMIKQASQERLGPAPDRVVVVPDDFSENPYQPEAYEDYMHNPANYTDVNFLQKWIFRFQQLHQNMFAVIKAHQRLEAAQDKLNTELEAREDRNEKIITLQQSLIDRLQRQVPGELVPEPTTKLQVKVSVAKFYGHTTQAEILYFALSEYRESRKRQGEDALKSGEVEEACNEFNDSQIAQNILDELHLATFELADNNYKAALYKGEPDVYREHESCQPKLYAKQLDKFRDTYAPDSEDVEEQEREEEEAEQSSTPEESGSDKTEATEAPAHEDPAHSTNA